MQQDVLVINTPESVDLRLEVAGLGSRFLAMVVDTLIQVLLIGLLVLAGALYGAVDAETVEQIEAMSQSTWGAALIVLLLWLIFFFYFLAFEIAWRGQSPGKRAMGLRVLDRSGRPASPGALAVRNLVRLIDSLPVPVAYPAGVISFLSTRLGQRLGDLAAGTIVVRERGYRLAKPGAVPGGRVLQPGAVLPDPQVVAIHAKRLGPDELDLLRRFLERRRHIRWDIRRQLGQRMALMLAAKMAYPYALRHPEPFLEAVLLCRPYGIEG